MVLLSEWRTYWDGMPVKVPEVKAVFRVTEESDIKDKIQDIKLEELPFLMVLTPSAKSNGSEQDNFMEHDMSLLYLFTKEGINNKLTFEHQEDLQPILEKVKEQMLLDMEGCGFMRRLDVGSMHTDPEKKLFSVLTGWSLSFSL